MAKSQSELAHRFKDFYQVLQLQPDADSQMVDQAYWHLARVYNAASAAAPWDRAKLDELNEAYSVLRSSVLREAYDHIRDSMLGHSAPPAPPTEPKAKPPLPVMQRQHAKSRSPRRRGPPKGPRFRPAAFLSWVRKLNPRRPKASRHAVAKPVPIDQAPSRRRGADDNRHSSADVHAPAAVPVEPRIS